MENNEVKENKGSHKSLIVILSIVVIITILALLYIYVAKPRFDAYVQDIKTKAELDTKDMVLLSIIQQIKEKGYAQITSGNQTLVVLIPYNPQA